MTAIVVMTREELADIIHQAARATADEVTKRLHGKKQDDAELWDAGQCAEYFGISRYTWAQAWAHEKDAPKAIVLGNGPRAKRRWKASEVKAWAARRQGKVA